MSLLGFVLPAATIGLDSLLIKPQRGFFNPEVPAVTDNNGDVVSPAEPASAILQPQITIEERHHDEIVITDHPVEKGAQISDHFYKLPAEVVIRCAWSNSPSASGGLLGAAIGVAASVGGPIARVAAAASSTLGALDTIQSILEGNSADQVTSIYGQLRALQVSGEPFDIYTGKRAYNDMLFRSISVTTDANSENTLMVTLVCRQVIFAQTKVSDTSVNSKALGNAQDAPVQDQGTQSLKPTTESA